MKISEIIVESRKSLSEGARIAHAEDLVFFEGSAGAIRAVKNLAALSKNRDTLSIKWDGRPALVCGRDETGTFIMTDKAGFVAKGYNGLYTSPDQFVAQKRSKGGDEGYLAKIVKAWPIMEAAFPPNYRGFILGDVMWFPGELNDTGRRFVFTPNTVTYEVDKNSLLGKQVGQGKMGFAVHTFFSAPGADGQPLSNTAGMNLNSGLCVLGPEIKNEATLDIAKDRVKQITQFIKTYAKSIDALLNSETLASLKMAGFPDLLYTFVNAQTKNQDLSHLYEKFIPWVQSNPKLSKAMAIKAAQYAQENSSGMKALFGVFDQLVDFKLDILNQLDSFEGPVIAHIAGQRGGEGYVNSDPGGAIKLVNRLGFSQANFAGNE